MIEWNKNLGIAIQTLLLVLTFVLLIYKRKDLGKNIGYFIIAIGIGSFIEIGSFLMKCYSEKINTILVYIIGVNLVVFSFFFFYFYNLLEEKKNKIISIFSIVFFIISYGVFAIFSKNFFNTFPFVFYCLELTLLLINIFLVLKQTFNSDKILVLKSYYPFWICIGLMVIYLGVTPLLIISNTASKMMNVNIFFIILFLVNIVGYSILLTGIFYAKNVET